MPTVDELRSMTPEQLAEHAEQQLTRLVLALFPNLDVRRTRHEVCDALASYATRRKEATVHTYHLVPTTGGTP